MTKKIEYHVDTTLGLVNDLILSLVTQQQILVVSNYSERIKLLWRLTLKRLEELNLLDDMTVSLQRHMITTGLGHTILFRTTEHESLKGNNFTKVYIDEIN